MEKQKGVEKYKKLSVSKSGFSLLSLNLTRRDLQNSEPVWTMKKGKYQSRTTITITEGKERISMKRKIEKSIELITNDSNRKRKLRRFKSRTTGEVDGWMKERRKLRI
jgi:hypothetical protein